MTINFHRTEAARAIFAAFCHTLGSKFTLGLTVLALCVNSATSQALPPRGTPPNTNSDPIREGSHPFAITTGADGNFWFTLSNSNEVARITPRGKFTTFRTPTLSNPAFITRGPDGNIWFGEGATGKIASVTRTGSTPNNTIAEFQFS